MTRSPDGVPRGPTEPPGAAPTAPAAEHSEVASPRPAEALDRRSFLRATAGGGAAIALASALPAGTLAAYPAAQRDGVRLQALSPKQYAVAWNALRRSCFTCAACVGSTRCSISDLGSAVDSATGRR
jgi:hypothetical protein